LPATIPYPKSAQTIRFLDAYVTTGEVVQSARDAGYSEAWALKNAHKHLKTYTLYVAYMKQFVSEQRAKLLAIDTQSVLDEIARIGMANEFDYIVVDEVEIDGKTIKRARRKELHELSRDEMVAIKVVRASNGRLEYDLRDKEQSLLALGKNLGLFNEKLIIERRNVNLSAKVDLSKVPADELLAIIQSFERTIGNAGAQRVIEAQ
jgi:phage terminase small subunit